MVVVPIDITVVDPAHLDEEASVPGIVRVAIREGQTLAVNERRRNMIEHSGTTASRCRGVARPSNSERFPPVLDDVKSVVRDGPEDDV